MFDDDMTEAERSAHDEILRRCRGTLAAGIGGWVMRHGCDGQKRCRVLNLNTFSVWPPRPVVAEADTWAEALAAIEAEKH